MSKKTLVPNMSLFSKEDEPKLDFFVDVLIGKKVISTIEVKAPDETRAAFEALGKLDLKPHKKYV